MQAASVATQKLIRKKKHIALKMEAFEKFWVILKEWFGASQGKLRGKKK